MTRRVILSLSQKLTAGQFTSVKSLCYNLHDSCLFFCNYGEAGSQANDHGCGRIEFRM
jgi:hypothetical protein